MAWWNKTHNQSSNFYIISELPYSTQDGRISFDEAFWNQAAHWELASQYNMPECFRTLDYAQKQLNSKYSGTYGVFEVSLPEKAFGKDEIDLNKISAPQIHRVIFHKDSLFTQLGKHQECTNPDFGKTSSSPPAPARSRTIKIH